ncbi:helix-turn-helix domain-containing protein [Chitinophaga sp. SYP-B3965]|uniref:helix-turn-helix transcriptional regulator n=1 Tax=Chitinophaga sp. SYP-B3965 TaxID=2663120 RepID=UPI0012996E30|nr:AraC family transcriptional regulator [Chitinophaga sp. SYP-B3965]MRG49027.1 helix-turn-helix domain-containing protein [Chitinophaga sp. SYP-B3965]
MNILIENPELQNISILPGVIPSMKEYEISVASATTIKGNFGDILTQQVTFDNFIVLYHVLHITQTLKFRIVDSTKCIPFLFGIKGTICQNLKPSEEPCLFEGQCKLLSVAALLSEKALPPGEYHLFQLNVAREYLSDLKSSYPHVLNDRFINEVGDPGCTHIYTTITPLRALLRIRSIMDCKDAGAAGRSQIIYSANQILIYIMEELATRKINGFSLSNKDKQTLIGIKAYIINNLGQKMTISALGKKFGIADTNLKINFKTMFHTTIHNFVIGSKMELAKLLLEEGEDVNQVACKVGYLETTNFIRAFKKLTGMTPANYRSGLAHRN